MTLAAPFLLLILMSPLTAAGRQGADDPALRAAVDRFFAMQEAEDLDGYLSLWSATAPRPRAEQLKYIFDAGDDKFSDITVQRITPAGDSVRVRVSATRDRTTPPRVPDGRPSTVHSTTTWSLLFVREGGDWKLLREGPAVDEVAESLVKETSDDAREKILAGDAEFVGEPLVMAISRMGGQAAALRSYASAQVAYERMRDVARRIQSARFEGEALQSLANAMYFQRNFPGALSAYEDALVVERALANERGIASALLGIATVRYSTAEYSSALTSYREVLAIYEKLDDEGYIATAAVSIGNILYLQGDYPGAIAQYTRGRDLNRKTLNTAGEADALSGLGRVYVAQGDYAAALDAFSGVLAEARARNSLNDQGTALLSIGDVHFRLGNLDAARGALDQGRTQFEKLKIFASAGRAWQAMAMTDLAAGRFSVSEDEYRKSAASCTAGSDSECVAAATVGLAFALAAQNKYDASIAFYKKGLEAFSALKRREQAARAEVGLALALIGNGDYAAALDAATHARTEAEALTNDDVLWRSLVAQASVLRHQRERPKALVAATAAVAAVDRLVETSRVKPSLQIARDSSSAFATLALLQAEDEDAAAAFETAERMRVHDLRLILAAGERDISRGMTDAEREEERSLAVEVVSLHAQLTREKDLPKPDAERIARLERGIAEAAEKRAAQQERLFARLPALRTWRGQMPPATRADVADVLPDSSTVLVEFVVGEEVLLTILARRGTDGVEFSTSFEAASRRALAGRVASLMKPETLRDRGAWTEAALQLIPGLSASFGSATRAIIVPDEVLWRVPFEALPTTDGYVSDAIDVVYAASVTELVRPPAAVTAPEAAPVVVAVAAPQISPAVVERLSATAPGWSLRAAETAEKEVARIVGDPAAQQTSVIDAAAATETAVRERLTTADVLHFAVPFRINGASPLFSSALLSPDPDHDGMFELREVMNLDARVRLTVFSDGATMSMRDAAAEVATVAWAWRAAGVPTLVMPRWAGDDAAAANLLGAFHARIRAGDAPDAALQTARASVRRGGETSAPFFWAAWMLVGGR